MKRRPHPGTVFVVTVLLISALTVWGCAPGKKAYKPSGDVECASDISWEVSGAAEVTEFKCFIANYLDKYESVHFTIAIKNVSDKPQRYRVNIFIQEGRAVGGLLPESGTPPVVEPGKEIKATYPMKDFKQIPGKIEVIIGTT